jgi:hypothetical protein
MKILYATFLTASCAIALGGCSKQNVQVNQAKLVGKWRSEKRDVGPLIAEMKRGSHGMPDHMIQPMIDKVKQSAELTEDWEFKADGTGGFAPTGDKPWPFTWRIVKSRGDKAVVEFNLNPPDPDPTTAEIVFQGDNRFTMHWVEDDEEVSDTVAYSRIP